MSERRACRFDWIGTLDATQAAKEKADDDDKNGSKSWLANGSGSGAGDWRRCCAVKADSQACVAKYLELGLAMRRRECRHGGQRLAAGQRCCSKG